MLRCETGSGRGAARPAPAGPASYAWLARMCAEGGASCEGRGPDGPALHRVCGVLALGLPEHLRDLVDRVEQLLSLRGVLRLLRRAPEQVVQVLVLLEVLGLEVVGPQHPEVVLHEVGTLLFDRDRALLEDRVVTALVLLLARLHRLGLDAGLCRVIHTARKVAMRLNRATGCEDAMQHGPTPSF